MTTALMAGQPLAIGSGTVPVVQVLGRNAGPMTGPGTNTYLIGSAGLAIVDPGPVDPVHLSTLLSLLAGRPLRWIFVTHTHGDHSPGALELQACTGAAVVGLAPDAGVSWHDRSFSPSRLYRDGEIIDCGEFHMRLLHTPGHASNHLCFLLEEERMLFTGDHILEGTTPVILPPDGNMSHYLDSLRRLQLLTLSSLAPGHGTLLTNPHNVIETLIRHRLRRELKVLTVLGRLDHAGEPVALEALTPRVYDDVPLHLLPWAQRTLLAHLLKLEEDGSVACTDGRWYLSSVAASQDATNYDS